MAISTNGGSNPTAVTYNGKNCTEVWYKSSPSATAVKVWPDLPPYKHVYIAPPSGVSTEKSFIIGNYEKDIYSQVTETHWEKLYNNAHSWGSFIYHNIAMPNSWIVAKLSQRSSADYQTVLNYKVPDNIKGIAISGPSSNPRLLTIEDGYIIPLNSSGSDEKVVIPENRKIEKSAGLSGMIYYLNDEVVSIPSPSRGGSVTYTIEIPQTAKYVIKVVGLSSRSASYWYRYYDDWYFSNTQYSPEYYYTDDYWEEKYNKEA